MTNTIIAADNALNIVISADKWQLVSTELSTPTILLEATFAGLVAHPVFVEARQLPGATLSPAQVARVVLGWAPETASWRLGMLLVDGNLTKYDTLSMIWCELAAWSDMPDITGGIRQVGQSLARILDRPFQLVEPDTDTRVPAFSRMPSQAAEPVSLASSVATTPDGEAVIVPDDSTYPEVDLKALPFTLDQWQIIPLGGDGLRWERTRGWLINHLLRIGLLVVFCILFLILGVGVRTSGLARVEPAWLPNAGLLIGAVLLVNAGLLIWQLVRAENIIVDTAQGEIYSQARLAPVVHWRLKFDQAQAIIISQTPARALGRPRRDDPMNIVVDVWIHVSDGTQFYELVALKEVEGLSRTWDDNVRQHHHYHIRRKLHLAEYDTPAHHAALHIAQRLNVPVYLDIV